MAINTTTQRISVGYDIYCASQVITHLKSKGHIIQLNQKHFPTRGSTDEVKRYLGKLARNSPSQLSKSSASLCKTW